MMSLDERFGPAVPAQGEVQDWEKKHRPLSRLQLDEGTAGPLKRFLDDVQDGWSPGRAFARDAIFIWIVDVAGDVRYAVEELVLDGAPMGIPKFQNYELTRLQPKLGHPALVDAAEGRIAGEIRFNSDAGRWYINNKSRRYGLHPSRTSLHLKSVAKRFRDFDIPLVENFIPPAVVLA